MVNAGKTQFGFVILGFGLSAIAPFRRPVPVNDDRYVHAYPRSPNLVSIRVTLLGSTPISGAVVELALFDNLLIDRDPSS